jgi:hypothetical protein
MDPPPLRIMALTAGRSTLKQLYRLTFITCGWNAGGKRVRFLWYETAAGKTLQHVMVGARPADGVTGWQATVCN